MHLSTILSFGGLLALPLSAVANTNYCPPTPASDHHQRHLWDQFVQAFYVDQNLTKAFGDFVAADVIQHNPFIADGRTALIAALEAFNVLPSEVTIVHQLFHDNIGVVHQKLTLPNTPITAIADFYRYNGTCIVEHWDVIQSVPANAINPHPLF